MLNIKVEGRPLRIKENEEWFCTLFPNDPDEMPQDFSTYEEAYEYGNEKYGKGNYIVEEPLF